MVLFIFTSMYWFWFEYYKMYVNTDNLSSFTQNCPHKVYLIRCQVQNDNKSHTRVNYSEYKYHFFD